MNNVIIEPKNNRLRTLAVIGFLAVVVFIAWLSIQIVNIFPNAINSLASLAESVYTYNPKGPKTITFNPVTKPITVGESLAIAWETPPEFGTYAFSYECQDGIAIDLKTDANLFESIQCGNSYSLGLVDKAELIIDSEKKAETEVTYTISYFKTNASEATIKESQTVTVTNPKLAVKPDTVLPDPIIETPTEATTTEVAVATSSATTTIKTPVVPVPSYVYEYTYAIPTSDPKGFTDLKLTYLGIGEIDQAGKFINTGVLSKNKPGAIQFSVHNIGTKTSEDWYFNTSLPGKVPYDSDKQTALKPNERTILTISFPAVTTTKLQSFSLSAKTKQDSNMNNNSIEWSVVVVE